MPVNRAVRIRLSFGKDVAHAPDVCGGASFGSQIAANEHGGKRNARMHSSYPRCFFTSKDLISASEYAILLTLDIGL